MAAYNHDISRERLNEDTYRRSYSYDINESESIGKWYGSGGGVSSVRKHFPETWLWLNESVSSTGSVNIAATIPDTITTWVATGYALNEKTGLGVAKESANVTAYLPFFVSLHLPFSIVSGEIAVIQALAFNYFPHDLYVTVRLKPSPKQFVGLIVNKYGQEEEQKEDIEHCILVRADTVESAYFMIKPKTVGTIDLTVEALTTRGRDVIQRQLIVKPPGLQEQVNVATFISLTTNGKFEKEVPVVYPLRIVPGSQRVQVSVIGDLFGPSLEHLDHLLQMPYGCGEQNMVRFAPAVAAATYLKATSRLSETLQRRVIEIMETGYQRQLTYKHSNGSYSAFSHENGSLWLTAFVLKSFAQARKFVYIDQVVVETGVRFLLDHQNQDGSFRDSGFVHNKALQGSSASTSKSLASFILITLKEIIDSAVMENKTLTAEVGHAILRTWTHLSAAAERMTGDYEMAITAYTLALMGKGGHDELLGRLEKSRSARGDGDTRFWENSVKSQEIEIAGYALLAYARLRDTARGLPVLRWLVKQRTPYGGFLSTQDTVVALQGLAEFATLTYSKDVSMSITIDDTASVHNLTINSDNMDVLQILEVPPEARAVTVKAVGRGLALIEMSVFYNVLTEERSSNFDLRVTTNSTDAQRFELNVCARWLGSDDSGMVLMEMAFPSGFEPEPIRVQHLDEVKIEENYVVPGRREMDHGHLVLYYNKMTSDLHCYQVKVQRKSIVVKPQPVLVRVYSYYDTDHKASALYIPAYLKKPGVCDLCGYECGCGYNPDAVPQERCGFSSTMRHTYPQQEMFPQPQTAIHPHMAMYPQPAVSPLVPGRYVENITSFSNLSQRLRPNMWRRGQTVPVSITRRLDEVPVHRTVSVQNSGPPMNVDPAFGLYPTAFSGFPGMSNGYSRQISTRGQTPIFDMNSVLGKSNRAIPSGFPDMTGFSRRISTRGETPISDMNSVLANWGPV
ncbi:CD109 antigen-like [Dreissena polymorpha]|nr:CD109 antigen-like [Dreissena polymorpha]